MRVRAKKNMEVVSIVWFLCLRSGAVRHLVPGRVLEWLLLMQPTKVKEFIDRALAASSHDLPGVLEGFKWVYEKVCSLQNLEELIQMN